MTDLFKEIIPSILQNKKNVLENEKDYHGFVVNRALSFHYDCVLQANEMNQYPGLPATLQYQYLLNTIRGYKRPFRKWEKRETIDDLIKALKDKDFSTMRKWVVNNSDIDQSRIFRSIYDNL